MQANVHHPLTLSEAEIDKRINQILEQRMLALFGRNEAIKQIPPRGITVAKTPPLLVVAPKKPPTPKGQSRVGPIIVRPVIVPTKPVVPKPQTQSKTKKIAADK